MSLEDVQEQSDRILQATVDLANAYITILQELILEGKGLIDNLAAAMEQGSMERVKMLIRIAEANIELLQLKEQLHKHGQSLSTTVHDQDCSEAAAMARQHGYMGHGDRPPSR